MPASPSHLRMAGSQAFVPALSRLSACRRGSRRGPPGFEGHNRVLQLLDPVLGIDNRLLAVTYSWCARMPGRDRRERRGAQPSQRRTSRTRDVVLLELFEVRAGLLASIRARPATSPPKRRSLLAGRRAWSSAISSRPISPRFREFLKEVGRRPAQLLTGSVAWATMPSPVESEAQRGWSPRRCRLMVTSTAPLRDLSQFRLHPFDFSRPRPTPRRRLGGAFVAGRSAREYARY